jgi:hypothetical protein
MSLLPTAIIPIYFIHACFESSPKGRCALGEQPQEAAAAGFRVRSKANATSLASGLMESDLANAIDDRQSLPL